MESLLEHLSVVIDQQLFDASVNSLKSWTGKLQEVSERLSSLGNHVCPTENTFPWNPSNITTLRHRKKTLCCDVQDSMGGGLNWTPILSNFFGLGLKLQSSLRSAVIDIPDTVENGPIHAEKSFLFQVLLNQTEIRLYVTCTDWFGTKRTSVWIQINRKMVDTIWFRVDLIRFRKDFSVCI